VEEIRPRYEFRIWGDQLGAVRKRLERLAEPKISASEETYLISAATDNCNAKIRASLMDIKVLVAVNQGLEQWKPIMKGEFPLPSSVIAEQVFPSLQVATPALPKPAYELHEFLDEVIRPHPSLNIAEVCKNRYQFRVGDCSAEYAQITINGHARDTAAVESVDPEAVLQLVRDLCITDANTSYIREIKRVLGLVAETIRA